MDDNESRASRIEKLKQKRLAKKKGLDSKKDASTDSSPLIPDVDIDTTNDKTAGNTQDTNKIKTNSNDITKDNSSETREGQLQLESVEDEPSKVDVVESMEDAQATVNPHVTVTPLPESQQPMGVTDDLKQDIQDYLDKLKAMTEIEINKIIQQRYEESIEKN